MGVTIAPAEHFREFRSKPDLNVSGCWRELHPLTRSTHIRAHVLRMRLHAAQQVNEMKHVSLRVVCMRMIDVGPAHKYEMDC